MNQKWIAMLSRWLKPTATGALALLVCAGQVGAATTLIYTYDALGRVTFVVDPTNGNRDYDYDKAGNRLNLATGTANDGASEPSSGVPTYIAITSSAGTILPSAASLYAVYTSCNGFPAVCTWQVRKLYASGAVAITVIHAPPNAVSPACTSGSTQQIATGYVRSVCSLTALSTVYGQ